MLGIAPVPNKDINFILSSSALGTLILAHNLLKKRGRSLFLASPGKILQEVLERMKLNTLFNVCDSVEEARQRIHAHKARP